MHNPKYQLIARILGLRSKTRKKVVASSRDILPGNAYNEDNNVLFKKGTEFESFVVRRFNPEDFTLVEWRSDKSVDGRFPLMCKFPDLEFYYEKDKAIHHFAVECKWKEHFYKECIYLNAYQLDNYRHYEFVTGYPTFIIIGIGNIPSSPAYVYVLPVSEIRQGRFHEFELEIFRRPHPHNEFNIRYQNSKLYLA